MERTERHILAFTIKLWANWPIFNIYLFFIWITMVNILYKMYFFALTFLKIFRFIIDLWFLIWFIKICISYWKFLKFVIVLIRFTKRFWLVINVNLIFLRWKTYISLFMMNKSRNIRLFFISFSNLARVITHGITWRFTWRFIWNITWSICIILRYFSRIRYFVLIELNRLSIFLKFYYVIMGYIIDVIVNIIINDCYILTYIIFLLLSNSMFIIR